MPLLWASPCSARTGLSRMPARQTQETSEVICARIEIPKGMKLEIATRMLPFGRRDFCDA
jgi:hypothetical protein